MTHYASARTGNHPVIHLKHYSPTLKSGIQYVKVVFCNYLRTVEELFIVRETNANVFIPKVVLENAEN